MFAETLFQTSAVMIRKSCLDAVGGFDETLRMGDDYELFLRIARHFELGYIDEPLVLYRQHPSTRYEDMGQAIATWSTLGISGAEKIVDLYPEIFEGVRKAQGSPATFQTLCCACLCLFRGRGP